MVAEARLEELGSGVAPTTEGWFVVNVRDAAWETNDVFGANCMFESPDAEFSSLGVRVAVLEPGQPNGLYHGEDTQEAFLVLHGECRLLVEGAERTLRAWDFFHCPPGTEHILVGAGGGPCVVVMTGTRRPGRPIHYPVSELALSHGAGVTVATSSPPEAYAGYPDDRIERPASWDALPWSSTP